MNISSIAQKSDTLGILASSLCFIHCLATPFIFITHSGIDILNKEHPAWWGILDLLFLVLSFIAIRWSVKTTSKVSMQYAFWVSWLLLLLVVTNEKLHIAPIPEGIIYVITLFLAVLHLFNKKYCRCENQKCCTHKTL